MSGQGFRLSKDNPYEVIVCGAGHAGCEAALAAARMGADVLMLTGNIDTVAQMSCNPAIGGQAKGHMVRELDALGGEMGVTADVSGIQYRLLNVSKGPAVQAPRTQCDKKVYQFRMKHILELEKNITLFQAMVEGLVYQQGRVVGVRTNLGVIFYGKTLVVTTGTFLRGLMHVGKNKSEGGRLGDFSAKGLSGSFLEAGIELERLKTGTPPRVLGSSIDFGACEEQKGDADPTLFGFYDTRGEDFPALFHVEHSIDQHKLGWQPGVDQVSCWITNTTEETESLVRENLHHSPLYSGIIKSEGPRYCPSIEDKYVRFEDKRTHRIFLEPEGRSTDEWYINGLSTSLPLDVQVKVLRSIRGLEHVQLLRPAYAVEYDYAQPTQLYASLESKKVENLFFAGQINGTSGYEEAACQGLLAGVNAILKVRDKEPLVIGRHEAYIGVLIDDLVSKGTHEPYRMFTSRAEHRLLLNHGSAELRLWQHADRLGLLPEARLARIKEKVAQVEAWVDRLENEKHKGSAWGEWIRKASPQETPLLPEIFNNLSQAVQDEVYYHVRYKGYLDREARMMKKMRHLDKIKIPGDIDYTAIKGLKNESREKLVHICPGTLGQASRISGVGPADVSLLLVAIKVLKQ